MIHVDGEALPGRPGLGRRIVRRALRVFVEASAAVRTAMRGVVAHRLRTFLSMLGIGIGVATLIGIVGIIQGLSKSFTEQLSQLGAQALYISSRPWMMRGDWWKYRNRPKIQLRDYEALRRGASLLTAVAPAAFTMADAGYQGERLGEVQVVGTNADYIETTNLRVELGRFLSPIEGDNAQPVAVIGAELRSKLFKGADPLGARLRVGRQQYTVIGALKSQGKSFGRNLDQMVVVPIGAFTRAFGQSRDLMVAVTAPPEKLSMAEDQIIEVMRRHRRLGAGQDDNFAINRQDAMVRMFNQQTAALFGVAVAVGLITLLVGGIGVMNIMLVAVTERTREIGVRRALGARKRTVLMQFLIESMFVSMVGGAVGTALGSVLAYIVNVMTPLAAVATPEAAIGGVLFSGMVGLLFGTWPAYRAAGLDPIEALRYE